MVTIFHKDRVSLHNIFMETCSESLGNYWKGMWCGVNDIFAGFQEIEMAREDMAALRSNV